MYKNFLSHTHDRLLYNSFQVFLGYVLLVGITGGYLLPSSCSNSSYPCTCYKHLIDCHGEHISQMPRLVQIDQHFEILYVHLYRNDLTSIPAGAFEYISSATELYIDLYENQIFDINIAAFRGKEDELYHLDLHNNRLASLPLALNNLTNLRDLYLTGNPLKQIDTTVMLNIGSNLDLFSIDVDLLHGIPSQLQYLTNLSVLTVNKIPLHSLTQGVFHNQESTLVKLDINHSKLAHVPASICNMPVLHTLSFESSLELKFHEPNIYPNCTHPMTSMLDFSLMRSNLTTFPSVFHLFPNLDRLYLSFNNIRTIANSSIPFNTSLTFLEMGINLLSEVPPAINKLLQLKYLDLRYNRITSLRANDLSHLHKLDTLHLTGNPLLYVSVNVFDYNPRLIEIDFGNTNMSHIPEAVVRVPNLQIFYLDEAPITCSCLKMSYLMTWNVRSLVISPRCSTGIRVSTYVINTLPFCPQNRN